VDTRQSEGEGGNLQGILDKVMIRVEIFTGY
jgi:hypothetical protein